MPSVEKDINPYKFKSLLIYTILSGLLMLGACALCYFFVDVPVDTWVFHHMIGSSFYVLSTKLGSFFSTKHWLIVMAISGGLALLALLKSDYQPILRICAPLAMALLIAFCAGTALKYGIGRSRPSLYFLMSIYSFTSMSGLHAWHSMPSGHTLLAFAAFTSLSFQWRPTVFPFMLLALCIGLSRLVVLAHFPSDVIFGAWVGVVSAFWARALCAAICTRMHRLCVASAPADSQRC